MSKAAIREDAATGVQERLEYLPTSRGLLYTWSACPPLARSGVVICSSVFGDFTANYHRERLLGRAIASLGYYAIRFHYLGEGNSQGQRAEMTFPSLCADTRAVIDHAVSVGCSEMALLGTRVGALVAAATVSSMPRVPLALWEPVASPITFITDALRAKRMSEAARGERKEATNWEDQLAQTGVLDLLGYEVHANLVDSLRAVDLLGLLGSEPRQVFIARFRSKSEVSDPISDVLLERGFSVKSGTFGLSESWWFQSERLTESGNLIAATMDWLSGVLSERR